MPSDNMEYSKWMYHSPDFTKAESKYKGLFRNQLIMAIEEVAKLNVVALDVNELSPMLDQSGASTALACKLLREIMLYFYKE